MLEDAEILFKRFSADYAEQQNLDNILSTFVILLSRILLIPVLAAVINHSL